MTERISQKKLADYLGLSTRQIRTLTDEGVLPKVVRNGKPSYEWPESNARYLAYREKLIAERAAPKDIEEARARYEAARAEMMELELAEKRRQLLPVDYVAREFEDVLQGLRALLLSFPAAWADRLGACSTTVDRQLMLEDAVREAMPLLERPAAGEMADAA